MPLVLKTEEVQMQVISIRTSSVDRIFINRNVPQEISIQIDVIFIRSALKGTLGHVVIQQTR